MWNYKTINKIKIHNLTKYGKNINFVKKYSLAMFNNNYKIDKYGSNYLIFCMNTLPLYSIKKEIESDFHSIHDKFNTLYDYDTIIINNYYNNLLSAYLAIDYYHKELLYIDKKCMNIIIYDTIKKLKMITLLDLDKICKININISSGFYSLDKLTNYILYECLKNSIQAITINPIININIIEDDKNIIINIMDNGTGIKDINNIYNFMYTTSKQNNLSLSGYGLGLSFSKFFIEFLNGSINIDSVYNKYTLIIIIFPKI
jgi:signal transduction histidine kinase